MGDRRLKMVILPVEWVVVQLIENHVLYYGPAGIVRCVKGIPADAVLVDVKIHQPTLDVLYVFYHPSFEPVPFSGVVPAIYIQYDQTSLMTIKRMQEINSEGEDNAGTTTAG